MTSEPLTLKDIGAVPVRKTWMGCISPPPYLTDGFTFLDEAHLKKAARERLRRPSVGNLRSFTQEQVFNTWCRLNTSVELGGENLLIDGLFRTGGFWRAAFSPRGESSLVVDVCRLRQVLNSLRPRLVRDLVWKFSLRDGAPTLAFVRGSIMIAFLAEVTRFHAFLPPSAPVADRLSPQDAAGLFRTRKVTSRDI